MLATLSKILVVVSASLFVAACGSKPKQDKLVVKQEVSQAQVSSSFSNKLRRQVAVRMPYSEVNAKSDLDFNNRVTVQGRVWVHDIDKGGDRFGSLVQVILNPVSPLSEQWYKEVCVKGSYFKNPADQRYTSKSYSEITNQHGQYVFHNIPSGTYYMTTRLHWIDESPFTGPVEYGGLLSKKVTINSTNNVIDINDKDHCKGYFF